MNKRRAFTLTELMVVCGILLVLVSILLPVVGSALKRGHVAAEIEQLRQLGAAAAIYQEEHGRFPLSVIHFRQERIWLSSLWGSPADGYRLGFRNMLLEKLGEKEPFYLRHRVPFRVSFVGFSDLFWDREQYQKVLEWPGAGWLVSFSGEGPVRPGNFVSTLERPFRRLAFDGSVLRRGSQMHSFGFHIPALFADIPIEEVRKELP